MIIKTAFYNFVQRPLLQNEKRTDEDHTKGWQTFINIIEIIEPDICLFLGEGLFHNFKDSMNENNIEIKELKESPKIEEIRKNNKTIRLLFIHSPSQGFDISKWSDFLQKKIPQYF